MKTTPEDKEQIHKLATLFTAWLIAIGRAIKTSNIDDRGLQVTNAVNHAAAFEQADNLADEFIAIMDSKER